jgi:hypothetical protein
MLREALEQTPEEEAVDALLDKVACRGTATGFLCSRVSGAFPPSPSAGATPPLTAEPSVSRGRIEDRCRPGCSPSSLELP